MMPGKAVLVVISMLFASLGVAAGGAQASVVPSPTEITFNEFFLDFVDDEDLSINPLGSATLTLPVIALPITGSTQQGGAGEISVAHQGSGFAVSGGPLDLSVNLRNLVVDTVAMSIFGDLDVNGLVPPGAPMTLFQLVDSPTTNGDLNLLVSGDLAGIMATFLGIANLSDVNVASLTAPQLVPLPPAAWLFLSALCSVLIVRKMRGRADA